MPALQRVIGTRKDDSHKLFGFILSLLVAAAAVALNVVSLSSNGFYPAPPSSAVSVGVTPPSPPPSPPSPPSSPPPAPSPPGPPSPAPLYPATKAVACADFEGQLGSVVYVNCGEALPAGVATGYCPIVTPSGGVGACEKSADGVIGWDDGYSPTTTEECTSLIGHGECSQWGTKMEDGVGSCYFTCSDVGQTHTTIGCYPPDQISSCNTPQDCAFNNIINDRAPICGTDEGITLCPAVACGGGVGVCGGAGNEVCSNNI